MKKLFCLIIFLCGITMSFAQSKASKNITTFEIAAPQLDTIRKIWVYLPEGYSRSDKSYPVLYMHDAQNLFDAETSFAGEWGVDEFLDAEDTRDVIVVGIEHGNQKRIAELTPFSNEKYGGGEGDKYIAFLVETLKPHIDVAYRTLPDRENTGIMGSSLGGLISFYAAVKYPEVFGKVGVFSPSFWFSQEIFDFVKNTSLPDNTRFYFMAGDEEDEEMVTDLEKMISLLEQKGMTSGDFQVKVVAGGQHNEASWKKEFPEAFNWLFPKKNSKLIFRVKNQ